MTHRHTSENGIKTTKTVFDIIECIHDRGACTLAEIADEVSLAKSTTHAHLVSLLDRGYVTRVDNEYRIGLRFLDIGTTARRNIAIFKYAKPGMERLAEQTGERTQFMVEEHGRGIYIYRAESSQAVPTDASVGRHRYLHACSAGKAILAHQPDHRVEQILDRWGLPALTSSTITDRDELLDELETVRQRGYATNKGESIESLWALGAPVKGEDGNIVGALSIGGPGHRMQDGNRFEDEFPNKLLGIIEEIELNASFD